MASKLPQKPIFFSIRKNSSYFMWGLHDDFFSFQHVCIKPISEDAFMLYEGNCLKVQILGRRRLVSATRYKQLRNGVYLLTAEGGGKYLFRLVKPLRGNA